MRLRSKACTVTSFKTVSTTTRSNNTKQENLLLYCLRGNPAPGVQSPFLLHLQLYDKRGVTPQSPSSSKLWHQRYTSTSRASPERRSSLPSSPNSGETPIRAKGTVSLFASQRLATYNNPHQPENHRGPLNVGRSTSITAARLELQNTSLEDGDTAVLTLLSPLPSGEPPSGATPLSHFVPKPRGTQTSSTFAFKLQEPVKFPQPLWFAAPHRFQTVVWLEVPNTVTRWDHPCRTPKR